MRNDNPAAVPDQPNSARGDVLAEPSFKPIPSKFSLFNRSLKFYFFISLAVLGITLGTAYLVAPWLHSAPIPLEIHLDAPANAQIQVRWNETEDPLALVAYSPAADGTANLWLAELPPRPSYQLTLLFQTPLKDAKLHDIKALDLQSGKPIYLKSAGADLTWFKSENIQTVPAADAILLNSTVPGQVVLSDSFSLPHRDRNATMLMLWALLLGSTIVAGALALPLFKFLTPLPASTLPLLAANRARSTRPLWIAFGIATTLHILINANARVILAGGDTLIYLLKAISMLQHHSYEPGGIEFELNRLPGYPLLLAGMIGAFGYHMTTLAMLQGLLFCVSVVVLALSLRSWVHPLIGAAAILLAILSPAQLWASRTLMAESTFGSFSILSLAAFFAHARTTRWKSMAWLFVYAILSAFSFFIRPNGITLHAGLLTVFLPPVVEVFVKRRSVFQRAIGTFRVAIPYMLTGLISLAAVLGWSYRNYVATGFFGATDLTGVAKVCGLMASGTFDVKVLNQTPFYDKYVTEKYKQAYYFPGFALRHDIFLEQTDGGKPEKMGRSTIGDLDNALLKVASDSKKISPWQVHIVGLFRSAWWALVWPDVAAYSKEGIRLDYVTFENTGAVRKGTKSRSIEEVRTSFLPYASPNFVYDDRNPNPLYSAYTPYADLYYNGWYVSWLGAALLSAIYVSWRGRVALAAPIIIFFANIALNVYLLNVFSRYIHILDTFLFFQCALGLSLLLSRKKAVESEVMPSEAVGSQPVGLAELQTTESR